ncbi:MAG: YbaB/EbfC family nucleoid-associated protein [Alphaproteobacteria bacterium]|nr:YbaB/EbfC family nucleoid-associated protein [Alphaproteobacteria bacterium]
MTDIMGMMGKLQDMQAKMADVQAEIATIAADGVAGGGLVNVTVGAKGELRALKIDPALFKEEDVEILQDLITAAHADALSRATAIMEEKMREVTAGLPIPPGMKLPF